MSSDLAARSLANQVAISGYLFRSHHAAFLAGEFSGRKEIPSIYRAWMMSIAADGAANVLYFLLQLDPDNMGQKEAFMWRQTGSGH